MQQAPLTKQYVNQLTRFRNRRGARSATRRGAAEQRAINSLYAFVRYMWRVIEPATDEEGRSLFCDNWHIRAICEELEAVTRGEVQNLVICIPPGHMKSLLVSVFWPAWVWLRKPTERTIFVSGSERVTIRDSDRTRDLLKSRRYQRLLDRIVRYKLFPWVDAETSDKAKGAKWGFKKSKDAKSNFANTLLGERTCFPYFGTITGNRGNGLVIDDPIDVKAATLGSPQRILERMLTVKYIYDKVLSSRLNNKTTGYRVIIMQRLHEFDLAGVVMERNGVRAVVLPTEYKPDSPHCYEHDPRTEEGELLFTGMFNQRVVDECKEELEEQYEAQHNQNPLPVDGQLFKRAYWQHYDEDPQRMKFDRWIMSIDCAFEDTDTSDYVVIQVWGIRGVNKYLLDQVRDRLTFSETVVELLKMSKKWKRARTKIIEKKANGHAVIQVLQGKVRGIQSFSPQASKYARAQVSEDAYKSGEIWLPSERYAPWIRHFKEEHESFPKAKNDDTVDAESQLVIYVDEGDQNNPLHKLKEEFGMFLDEAA